MLHKTTNEHALLSRLHKSGGIQPGGMHSSPMAPCTKSLNNEKLCLKGVSAYS